MNFPLIAHRGEPEGWPENSLAGYQAALEAGAGFIETDIQITADGIAVLNHDSSALKVTGVDLQITATNYAALQSLPAGYPQRFAERYRDLRITRLDQLVTLLQQWPQVQAFIEIKQASITAHGNSTVVDTLMSLLEPVLPQIVFISFNHEILGYIRSRHEVPTGWVLHEWSAASQAMATSLAPDYLFCSKRHLPEHSAPLWPGPWRWAVYVVNNPDEVPALLDRGIDLVETDVIGKLMADQALRELFIG